MTDIDTYLEHIESQKRKELERIRTIAKQEVPDAEDTISYGMPTLKYKGKPFLGFDAHKEHIGIYPYGGEEIALFKDQLEKHNYAFSKGAIRIPFNKPIPQSLLKEIIQHRINRLNK